jgi:hypothetical protein
MDPTLAPGYVAPQNGKSKSAKGHHWTELKKSKAQQNHLSTEDMDDSQSETDSMSNPTTPRIVPRTPLHRVDGSGSALPRHPRISSWYGGRPNLSDNEGIGGPADLEEVPIGVKRQALCLEKYAFPDHRLRSVMEGIFTLPYQFFKDIILISV